jgi:predicted double-glycine peptidase
LTRTQLGYKGLGYASTFEQLSNLKIPVIVYVKHRKTDHFSVLRGVDEESVWLSDPAIGHVTYSKEQFMRIWTTRDGRLAGKFFVVVPEDEAKPQNKDYFKKMVSRQSAQAVKNFEQNRLSLKRQ